MPEWDGKVWAWFILSTILAGILGSVVYFFMNKTWQGLIVGVLVSLAGGMIGAALAERDINAR